MTDNLERLHQVYRLRGDTFSSMEVIDLAGWAAAEIETLRAENDRLRAMLWPRRSKREG